MGKPDDKVVPAQRSWVELPARKRLDALLEFPDSAGAVRRVPAEDLYLSIAEVGLDDASDIVQLASPSQFRTFVDLAGWRKDRLSPADVLAWVRSARGEDERAFLAKLQKLDLEVLEYVLRERVVVHDLEEEPDANPEGFTVETPEGKYLLEIRAEGQELDAVRQILDELFAQGPLEASRLLESIRWESTSELEEIAYRFRSARLADLGFPELYEALSIFAFADPAKLGPEAPPPSSSSVLAQAPPPARYLEAAFGGLAGDERAAQEAQLRRVVNSALVAEGAEPGDLDAIRRVSELARDYLSLGLEFLTGRSPDAAADAVRRFGFKKIFQVGFSLTLRLKFRVERMARGQLFSVDGALLLLPEEARAVSALRRKRPLRALKVEGAEPVPFRSERELAEASALLDRAEGQLAAFRALLGADEGAAREALEPFGEGLPGVGADRVWIAAVARAALGEPDLLAPVPAERVRELGPILFEGEPPALRIRAEARQKVLEAVRPRAKGAEPASLEQMVDWALSRLRDELAAPLRHGELDPALTTVFPVRRPEVL